MILCARRSTRSLLRPRKRHLLNSQLTLYAAFLPNTVPRRRLRRSIRTGRKCLLIFRAPTSDDRCDRRYSCSNFQHHMPNAPCCCLNPAIAPRRTSPSQRWACSFCYCFGNRRRNGNFSLYCVARLSGKQSGPEKSSTHGTLPKLDSNPATGSEIFSPNDNFRTAAASAIIGTSCPHK